MYSSVYIFLAFIRMGIWSDSKEILWALRTGHDRRTRRQSNRTSNGSSSSSLPPSDGARSTHLHRALEDGQWELENGYGEDQQEWNMEGVYPVGFHPQHLGHWEFGHATLLIQLGIVQLLPHRRRILFRLHSPRSIPARHSHCNTH